MNGTQFDRVMRSLAASASRRRFLAGALSAGVGALFGGSGRRLAARQAVLFLGDPCDADRPQCPRQASCQDNGIADDGALNCCHHEDYPCSDDAHCCRGLVCRSDDVRGSACRRTSPLPQASVSLGGACVSSDDCLWENGEPANCAASLDASDGWGTCCRRAGTCSREEDCCPGTACVNGGCSTGGFGARPLGAVCPHVRYCLPGGGLVGCEDNGPGQASCCHFGGGRCAEDAHCCGARACVANFCTGDTPIDGRGLEDAPPAGAVPGGQACTAEGAYCAFGSDCCSGVCAAATSYGITTPAVCRRAGWTDPGRGSCTPSGGYCTGLFASSCCSGVCEPPRTSGTGPFAITVPALCR